MQKYHKLNFKKKIAALKHCIFALLVTMAASLPVLAQTYNTLLNEVEQYSPANKASGPHIVVSLIHDKTSVVPGEEIQLGILFSPQNQWHTYWRNPGDSGEAPTIAWESDAGLEFGEINWPCER